MLVKRYRNPVDEETLKTIENRFGEISTRINKDFWESSQKTHCLFVGSYGRGTAVSTSDIDVLIQLPYEYFQQFNSYSGNGQSALLQKLKDSVVTRYKNTDIGADGQVVQVDFSDGMMFELLPAFQSMDNSFQYPDTHQGGSWKRTDPLAEQKAMREKDASSNGLLFDTCRHIRYLRDQFFKSYKLSGIVIDSFVYQNIGNWRWDSGNSSKPGSYEKHLLDSCQNSSFLIAPGSYQIIDCSASMECLKKVLNKMAEL